MYPLVSIICTCYNQGVFLQECLNSVVNQTYKAIQLIIIDNASIDPSDEAIQNFLQLYPQTKFIKNHINIGLCKAFNQALQYADGKYIIDLAADDVLLPTRIEHQVKAFEQLPANYAVVFSNATYIDADSSFLHYHYPVDEQGKSKITVPTGDVFKEILQRYFICTPTIMIRKSVLEKMGGYDENLSYEDFDFFVRSSRQYHYYYIDKILTQKRLLPTSLSSNFYRVGNTLLASSVIICQKAYELCQTEEEINVLASRIEAFIKKCVIAQDVQQILAFRNLLIEMGKLSLTTNLLVKICQLHLPFNKVYSWYSYLRSNRNH